MNKESMWAKLSMEEKISAILDVNPREGSSEDLDHFGRPFLTSYQIAIEFAKNHRPEFGEIGLPVGGERIGERKSLAQYIARELSQRIKRNEIQTIEIALISKAHLENLEYNYNDKAIKFSGTNYDPSIFRLVG
ncbi:MAG: hypothetical protein ACD_39C02122G0003 [uncultured bacterium]|nr:MAG: hypothetical protein ACD_39C02122G0003 [uncultured bacterium]